MLEALLYLLLQVALLQSNADKPESKEKSSDGKKTTITTEKTSPSSPGIGSGGWDPNG